ncbi:MAG: hypothetical protein ACD_20C00002G0008 [uncultured bacterium]|nr:MAG: hypothetical protein ACD_20C00002G0008 [uncultured bacterium]HBH19098.1 trehalose-6-phosphate synthase [Cyanobacteria bacterium UBA9579]
MRLIIVANRSPYHIKKRKDNIKLEKAAGGLVAALDPVVKNTNGMWVCTGESQFEKYGIETPYEIKQIKLTKNENSHYYEGFCNRQIWPLFHYFPGIYKMEDKDWNLYKQVNQKFANEILDVLKPNDKIWIQDYHLMLVPQMLREQGVTNKIGFFLHIPFPSVEIYKIIPRRREILEGLLGCDLIGFHTQSYKKHFMECVDDQIIDAEVDYESDIVKHDDIKSKIVALPISIDFNQIDEIARGSYVTKKVKELRRNFIAETICLGVDRLDYTKGIVEKLEGLEYFLENNPDYHKKITLIQIAVPTRTNIKEYMELKKQVDETVGRINGKFSKDGWNPVSYIYNSVSLKDLVSYYSFADFVLISALRDGLNLVAKEYIASRINNDGMLVLSEFTGAAEELDTGNTMNPYDVRSISEAILKVKNTDIKEKEEIMVELREKVKENNIYKWVNDFLSEL